MANAFQAIAPQSGASTSSLRKPCYDVFINHHGKDVKRTLASIIYNMFDLKGVATFLDEKELELGDSFPKAIEEAMRSASIYIAIFSPNYADSPWCLEELSFMLQINATINVTIIPVFYDVQPTDLRYVEKGKYAGAFDRHRSQSRYKSEKIEEWKEALISVSYKNGCIVDANRCDQGKLSREIVEIALHKLRKPSLDVAMFPVALDEAVQDFHMEVGYSTRSENVEVGSSTGTENMNIVGIVGMGGIGKSTLAKELYNRKRSSFRRSSFLFNVRNNAASTNTLLNLQKQLLKDLDIKHPEFNDIDEGKEILATRLTSITVLIVLDDVDNLEQMHALLPANHNLGRDSFIIITARLDKEVLKSWGISTVYQMKLLARSNAKYLFCRHAFKQPYSQLGSEHLADLIDRFVKACDGLPLSLKVFGAMLKGKSEAYWESQLQKIPKILPKDISDCLKLSYDALDSEVQNMFLDVACFFIGGKKSLVVAIWDGSEWSGEVGWQTLVDKCLVGLDEEGNIEMHDNLRDLGRQIAGNESPSRIWNEKQMSFEDGRTPIRGIVPKRFTLLEHFMEKIIHRLPSPHLQLLVVDGNKFKEEFAALSRHLVWLRWYDFNKTSLPSWLSLEKLRVLELDGAKNLEKLWQDNVQLPLQLRELIIILTGRTCFQGLPRSIGHLTYLKKIVLNGSGNGMSRLPDEFCHLRSLEILQLSNLALLSLPDRFGELTNLRILVLSGVPLNALPGSFKQLRLLQFLDISNSQTFCFTSEMLHVLELMTKLQTLRISYCPHLVELPHLTTQVSLRELNLRYTGLREISENIGQLTKLETLVIGSDSLTSLPGSLGELSCLTSLAIYDCDLLQSLPEAVGRLSNLQALDIHTTPVRELSGLPSGCNLHSLKCFSLFDTRVSAILISDYCCPSLETLRLSCNTQLTAIRGLPKTVREIIVHGCEKMWTMFGISNLRNLENLVITDCPKLEMLQIPAYMFSVRGRIRITGCPKATIGILDDDEVIETATQSRVFNDEGKVAMELRMSLLTRGRWRWRLRMRY